MSLIKTPSSDNLKNNINNQIIFDDISNYKFDYNTKLGEGRFGKVRLAIHKLTNEKVAIKIIDKNQIKLKEQRQRIDSEIQILKELNHYNICKLYSIIENEERIYLIQEYIQGNDLNFFINQKEKPLIKERKVCQYFRQIISAVEYLHKLGIAHRDLKPENILINKNNDIKLIDFGLSKIFSKGELLKTPCGSPYYAAPEMVKGNKYNGLNSDIWSLGIILYLMLFQELPFMDADINRLYKKISEGQYEIPEDKINIVSKDSKDLISKILEINPKKRIKINGIKNHKWFNRISSILYEGINVKEIILPVDEEIVEEINNVYKYDKMRIRNTIIRNLYNNIRSLYFILLEKKMHLEKESVSDLHSHFYIEYIKDEKNKLNNFDNNIENVLKKRMNSKEELSTIIYYEENKEIQYNKNDNTINIDDNINNKAKFIRSKKNKTLTLNKNININFQNIQFFINKNKSCNEKFIRMKTNDEILSENNINIKKKFSEKAKNQINVSGNLKENEEEKKFYSDRIINNKRVNSSKNNKLSKFHSSSIDKKLKANNHKENNINNDIYVNRINNNFDKNIKKERKKKFLSVSYDRTKSKSINKNTTHQIIYKNNNKDNQEKNPININKYILDKINSNKKNKNIIGLIKNVPNDSLLSPINKSNDGIKNKNKIKQKLSFSENIKKFSNKNISALKLISEDSNKIKIKIKPKKTVSNLYQTKENFENKKINNYNTTKSNEKYNKIKGKTINAVKSKKNHVFLNHKTNSDLLNKKIRQKLNIGKKNDDNLVKNNDNNIKINININNSNCESLPKTNTYSTINNLSSNKKHFKSFAITNSSSKQNNKNKIVVNLVKKENNENNIINHKNEPKNLSSSFTNMIKKDIILNEHKTNLKNQIFDEKNIINYESPFDLNFIFLYKKEENIKILFEKYLQKKKIGFNIAKEKEKSNNKKSKNKIHYNCHKKNGMKFSVNIAKSLNESNNKIYIWKIKNQSTIKYDFIKLINTFNNSCLK